MSITNKIGNNPTMDSRITFTQEAAVSKIPKTANDSDTNKTTVKPIEAKPVETKPVSNMSANELRYNVNEQLGQVIVAVIDSTTNKIIKEIPSTEIQQMRVRIKDAIGSFIDETR